jgi:hypothetical protein
MAFPVKNRADAFQVIGRVHARQWGIVPYGDRDGVTVPKRPQLFQRLEAFYGGMRELGERS